MSLGDLIVDWKHENIRKHNNMGSHALQSKGMAVMVATPMTNIIIM